VFGLGALALLAGTPSAHAATGINKQINYQARLLNSAGATVPDGTYNMQFKIYQDGTGCVGGGTSPCGGTLKWTEEWLNHNSQGVTVTNGYFSIMLGAGSDSAALGTAVDFNQSSLWLSVNIGSTSAGAGATCTPFSSCSGDGEMLPFTQFAAAPYAFNASQLGGLSASGFAQLAANQTFTGANILQPTTNITGLLVKQTSAASPTADIFNVQTAGSANIIQATSAGALSLTSAGALTLTGAAASIWDIGNNTLSLQTTSNGAITTGSGLLTVGGNLTFSGSSARTISGPSNSLTIDTGGALNIGTTNATSLVFGSTANNTSTTFKQTSSTTAFQIQNSSNIPLLNADTTNMRLDVGVGGTATSQLYVAGQVPSSAVSTTSIASSGLQDAVTSGRYLYAAAFSLSKLYVYDVSNPASPAVINGTGTALNSGPQGIALAGHYIYAAEYSGKKLEVIDVSNPNAPSVVGSVALINHGNSVTISGRYAYVATDTGVDVIDVSNPALPVKITNVSVGASAYSVFASGRYVYVTTPNNGTNAFMKVIDMITNTVVGSFNLSGGASGAVICGLNYGPRSVYVQGRYAFVGNCGNSSLDIFDVSNPTLGAGTPTKTLSTGSVGPQAVFVQGRYLYAALNTSGTAPSQLGVYDISTISSTALVGTVSTASTPESLYISGRYAYVPTFSGANFQIFDLGGAYVQQFEAGGIESGTLTVNSDAGISGNTSITGGLQVGESLAVTGNVSSSGSVLFQNAANSATAFQVQNASGAAIFSVDTTSTAANGNTVNYLTYPGFETGSFANASTGWAAVSPGTLTQNSTKLNTYNGLYSAKVVTTASNGGLTTGSFVSAPPSGTYIVSFYAEVGSGTIASTAFTVQSTDGATHTCSPGAGITVGTTGFQRLFCSITATGAITALQITQNDGAPRTIYLDGVQLESNSFNGATITTPTPYQIGGVQIRGILQNPLAILPAGDSTNVLQVSNAAGTNTLLNVDTANSTVSLGSVGSTALASTVNIANTSGAAVQTVTLGSIAAAANITTIQGGNSAQAINILAAASGNINIGTNAVTGKILNIGTVGTTNNATTIHFADTTGSAAQILAIGSLTSATSTTTIQGGTGASAITLQSGNGSTITIGSQTASTTNAIVIGASGSTTNADNVSIDNTSGANAGTVTIGGSAAATGTITLGQSTATQIINIANGVTAAGATKTVNIGTAQNNSTGVTAINIGLNNTSTGANTVTIKAGGSGRSQGPSVTLGNVATQSNAVCSSLANNTAPTAGTAYELEDCNVAPAIDYAEYYPTDGTGTYGDIMTLGSQTVQEYDTDGQGNILYNSPKRTVSKLVKATQPYAHNVLGVLSNNYDEFTSTGLGIVSPSDNPMPVALNGRIPVNISPSSQPIQVGDYITTSSDPGKGMKATQAGEVIGKALAAWDPGSGETQIMVFVEQGYYAGPTPAQTIQSGGAANLASLAVSGNTDLSNLAVSGSANFSNLNASGTATLSNLAVTGTATAQNLAVIDTLTAETIKVTGLAEVAKLQVDGQINLGSATEDPSQESPHPITKRFKSSKPIPAGAVVIADTASGYATTTATAGDTRVVGVAVTAAANAGDVIEVAIGGTAKVLVSGAPAVGQLLHSDSAEGKAAAIAHPAPGEVVGKVLGAVDQNGQIMVLVTLD